MADRPWFCGRAFAGLAAAISLSLLVAACSSDEGDQAPVSGVSRPDDHGYSGTYLGDDPFVVADVALPDTEGAPYSIATAPVELKIVFFGYSMCPDICQIVMSTVTSALSRLGADRDKVEVVFVTTDPNRDTGPVLREYLDRFGAGYVGLTGDLKDITALGDSFKVSIEDGKKLPSGGYEVDHSTYTYGVVGDGAEVIWGATTSPADMAADMIKLLKS